MAAGLKFVGLHPKILPITALLITILVTILLIWQWDKTYVGRFNRWVRDNQGSTNVIQQAIGSILGALWVYIAATVFKLRHKAATCRTDSNHAPGKHQSLGGTEREAYRIQSPYTENDTHSSSHAHTICFWKRLGWCNWTVLTDTVRPAGSIFISTFDDAGYVMNEEFKRSPPDTPYVSNSLNNGTYERDTKVGGFYTSCPVPGYQGESWLQAVPLRLCPERLGIIRKTIFQNGRMWVDHMVLDHRRAYNLSVSASRLRSSKMLSC